MTAEAETEFAETVFASDTGVRRSNMIRDALAGALVVIGLLLPWTVGAGVGISGTAGWVIGLLVVVSLLPLAALALGYRSPQEPGRSNRLRLLLSVPYLVVAVGFVAFSVVQSIRYGGSGTVSPGIGPGIWFGTAGAVLAAQPIITTAADGGQPANARATRMLGIASLVLAGAATLFNLYWRTRFVIPHIGDEGVGVPNLVVAVAAVLYGVVALAPVVLAARWLMSGELASRLATVLLGASTLVAGVLVWILPVGRDLDAFHGIAQNTSTTGVGFEGYLAWVAAAALVATVAVLGVEPATVATHWQGAARKCLLLIVVWCAGSAVKRIVDLVSVSVLDLPALPYNSTALMAFDLVVAVLAMWLFLNHRSPRMVMTLLFGVLLVLLVSRVVLGVALIPRVPPLNASDITSVYGNTLAQQITSTFDVVLCVLAVVLLAVPFVAIARPVNAPTVRDEAEPVVVYTYDGDGQPEAPALATVRIARAQHDSASSASTPDRVADVLAESTRRFAAGTTYGGGDRDGS